MTGADFSFPAFVNAGLVTQVFLPLMDGGVVVLLPSDNPMIWFSDKQWLGVVLASQNTAVAVLTGGQWRTIKFTPGFNRVGIPRGADIRLDLSRAEFDG